jgi:hypothetical protein
MHKFVSKSALVLLVLTLAACGGSSDKAFQTPTTGTPGTPGSSPAASVMVTSGSASIPSDNSASATITALVRDANNAAVSGATVTFSASAGSVVVTQGTTDANGNAIATLSASGAAAGTAITVTATTGTVSGKATVNVVANQQSISLLTSSPQIPSDNSAPATISAVVRDASNRVLPNVVVNFSASSGAITPTATTAGAAASPVVPAGTTDANGVAQAMLGTAGDPTDRTITVTATVGSSATSATVNVSVIGTTLTVTGPATLVQGNQGTYTVSLTDSKGAGIPTQTVNLTSASGNTLSAASVVTDSTGKKTFTLTATKGGADTITATSLGLTATQALTVSSQTFAFTAPANNTQVPLSTNTSLVVNWTNNGAPVAAGSQVTFSSTRGTLSAGTATTDAQGNATVMISSNTAGPGVVSATATGVSAQVTVDFIATTPTSLALQAAPSTVATQGQSTLTATVRDASNNLVEGQVVNFTITQDPTGGSLSVASATTDAQGQASTVYTASTTTSAKNGVVVQATVAGTAVSNTAALTVGGQAVFLSLGTGNTIVALNNTQYELPYSVQAIDSAGNGVNNVQITITVTSLAYGKGSLLYDGHTWEPEGKFAFTTSSGDPYNFSLYGYNGCRSEDVNNNGILDPGEDYNGNGKLDPGLVASTDVGSGTTSSGGSLGFNLIYPKDHAYWVAVGLTAAAIVNGTQSSTTATFWLPGLAQDYSSQTTAPPGANSPYGQAATCADPN